MTEDTSELFKRNVHNFNFWRKETWMPHFEWNQNIRLRDQKGNTIVMGQLINKLTKIEDIDWS